MSEWTKVAMSVIKKYGQHPKGAKIDLRKWDQRLHCPADGTPLLPDNVYSNCYHEYDKPTIPKLVPGVCAGHAAERFMGFIWTDGKWWYEAVWRFNKHIASIRAKTLDNVIKKTNKKYGRS